MPQGFFNYAIPTSATAGIPDLTPPGYGHDLSCTTDIDPMGIEVDGLTTLAQALFRRVITPRGTLLDDPNYGIDLTGYVNDDLSPSDVARIGASVDAEFLKDERVLRSSTTITLLGNGTVITVASAVTPNSGATFQLVLSITQVTAQILSVSQ